MTLSRCVVDLCDSELKGKRVLVRCNFDVPLDENQNIMDDTRIRLALPTISYLATRGYMVTACSVYGQPRSEPQVRFSMERIASRLGNLLGQDVPQCNGQDIFNRLRKANLGDVSLLDTRELQKEMLVDQSSMEKQLAAHFDIFVDDSTEDESLGRTGEHLRPSVCGFLLAKEQWRRAHGSVSGWIQGFETI